MLVVLILVASACQVSLDVHVVVKPNGSGTVTVGLGLDDEALGKVGDLAGQLRVDDLRAAGWTIEGPAKRPDGDTWVTATKGFADAAEATQVMDEVNGRDGAFRDWTVTRSSSPLSTSYAVDGTVDLTKGVETFGDAQLSQLFGGDPIADGVKRLESEQGRPISDQVDVRVTVETPGRTTTWEPTLADPEATTVKVRSTTTNWTGVAVLVVALVAAASVAVAVLLRRRAVRRRRARPRSAR